MGGEDVEGVTVGVVRFFRVGCLSGFSEVVVPLLRWGLYQRGDEAW
jgi:hypothetical protein